MVFGFLQAPSRFPLKMFFDARIKDEYTTWGTTVSLIRDHAPYLDDLHFWVEPWRMSKMQYPVESGTEKQNNISLKQSSGGEKKTKFFLYTSNSIHTLL